jgi:sterol desaturase/sphingolipid hydroxylase (fatty acid hydroxylase superfamily)
MLIELIFLEYKRTTFYRVLKKRNLSFYNDLISWLVIHLGLYNFILFVLTFGIFHYLSGQIFKLLDIRIDHLITNPLLLSFIVFIVTDFKNYWFHRIVHYKPFWEFHAFHHSATSLNVITTDRSHFLENTVSILLDGVMYALFQAPISMYFGIKIAIQFLHYLQHTEINWKMGWLGRWIFVSPHAHLVHHSSSKKHSNKNFGSILIIWDRIFGTYYETNEPIKIGILDNNYNKKGYIYDIYLGIINFVSSLKQKLRNV